MEELVARLTAAGIDLAELRGRVEAGAPWPLAERFDDSPEAAWGPPEVLAHVEEMLGFWLGEIERVIDGPEPAPFGRLGDDAIRVGTVGRDRTLPLRELFARIANGIERFEERLPELSATETSRRGVHPRRGEMTVEQIVEVFVVSHLEGHVGQLREVLGRDPVATGG